MISVNRVVALLSVALLMMLCPGDSFAESPNPDHGSQHDGHFVDPNAVVDVDFVVNGMAWASAYTGESRMVQSPAAWSFPGENAEDLGYSVASAGDVNGDGFDDLIVGANYFSDRDGRAMVFHGSQIGLGDFPLWVEEPNHIGAEFGRSVARAGDVNNDGYSDVIIGGHLFSDGENDVGGAWVYLGSSVGLAPTPAWTQEGDQASARYGFSVASAGDVNGDGFDDVIVGSPDWKNLSDDIVGHVWVYHGSSSGLATMPSWDFAGSQAGGELGYSVATAGDVNGDGFSDVIVGQRGYDNPEIAEGRAVVFLGAPNGLEMAPAWDVESNIAHTFFGASVASAGDVNSDGFSDVIIGAPLFNSASGAAYVYLGSGSGLATTATWSVVGDQTIADLGLSVASAGDVDADGFDDVILGAPRYDNGESNEGRVYLYRGTAAGLELTPTWTEESNTSNVQFGRAVASAGDVNGDCGRDVAVGAPFSSPGGSAFVYHGTPTDTDGDGLCDRWELRGVDLDSDLTIDFDLPSLGADHEHKDLFIEIDAMRDRAPAPSAVNAVVASFASVPNNLIDNPDNQDGITMHVTVDDTEIPP